MKAAHGFTFSRRTSWQKEKINLLPREVNLDKKFRSSRTPPKPHIHLPFKEVRVRLDAIPFDNNEVKVDVAQDKVSEDPSNGSSDDDADQAESASEDENDMEVHRGQEGLGIVDSLINQDDEFIRKLDVIGERLAAMANKDGPSTNPKFILELAQPNSALTSSTVNNMGSCPEPDPKFPETLKNDLACVPTHNEEHYRCGAANGESATHNVESPAHDQSSETTTTSRLKLIQTIHGQTQDRLVDFGSIQSPFDLLASTSTKAEMFLTVDGNPPKSGTQRRTDLLNETGPWSFPEGHQDTCPSRGCADSVTFTSSFNSSGGFSHLVGPTDNTDVDTTASNLPPCPTNGLMLGPPLALYSATDRGGAQDSDTAMPLVDPWKDCNKGMRVDLGSIGQFQRTGTQPKSQAIWAHHVMDDFASSPDTCSRLVAASTLGPMDPLKTDESSNLKCVNSSNASMFNFSKVSITVDETAAFNGSNEEFPVQGAVGNGSDPLQANCGLQAKFGHGAMAFHLGPSQTQSPPLGVALDPSPEGSLGPKPPKLFSQLFSTQGQAKRSGSDYGVSGAAVNELPTSFPLEYISHGAQSDPLILEVPKTLTDAGKEEWNTTIVGYFLGPKFPYSLVSSASKRLWDGYGLVNTLATDNGFYFFSFSSEAKRDIVLEGGPWYIAGRPFILLPWKPNLKLDKEGVHSLLIWVNLYGIPLEFGNPKGISCIASVIGKLLQVDAITTSQRRITYASVCIEVSGN